MDTQTSDTETSPPVIGKFLNKRVCAFLIDSFFVILVTTFLLEDLSFRMVEKGLMPATLIFEGLYLLLRDSVRGKSLGKLAVGLQVVDLNGRPCGPWRSIVRNLIFVLPGAVTYAIFSDLVWVPLRKLFVVFYLIEYLAMRFSAEGRRFGDRWAGTQVVDTRPHLKDSLFLGISLILFLLFSGAIPASRFVISRLQMNAAMSALETYKKTNGEYPKKLEELKLKPNPFLIYTSYRSRSDSPEFYLTGINAPFPNLSYSSQRKEWRIHKGGMGWTREEMGLETAPKPSGDSSPQTAQEPMVTLQLKEGGSIQGKVITKDANGVWLEIDETAQVYFRNDEIEGQTQS